MVLLFFVLCLGSLGQTWGDVQTLDPGALKVFLKPFRQSVLAMVASGWNETLEDSAQLKQDMQVCSDKIKVNVGKCEVCTSAACRGKVSEQVVDSSPEFTDYLKFAAALLLNPTQFLQEPLNEIGDRLGNLVDLLGDGSESFIDSMSDLGNSVGDKFNDVFHGLEIGLIKVKDTFTDLGNGALDGIKGVGGTIGDGFSSGASSVGHALENAGKDILHGLGSIFGRKRVAVTPEIRHCMEQCDTCDALLITDQRQMITAVCGADIVKFNDTVRKQVRDIKGVFMAVSDKINPVIVKIEYDPASLTGTTFSTVYITANVRGRYVRYQSTQAYDMLNYATSAHRIAAEFWGMWTR